MGLISGYPLWLIFICLFLGFTYAAFLYLGKKARKKWRKGIRISLFILRFLVVSLLAFFLMEPLIRLNMKISNKPVLVVVTDNSMSMTATSDSVFVKTKLPGILQDWSSSISDDIDVNTYCFSDSLFTGNKNSFDGRLTDIGQVFSQLRTRYINRNLIGIVLVSDGIYNTGVNPLSAIAQVQAPVFPVAVGDTTSHIDAAVVSLNGNREVVFNNYFPIEFSVVAVQANGQNMTLKVNHNSKEILSEQINIQGNSFSRLFNLKSFAAEKGLNKITVSLSSLKDEKNLSNNTRVFYFNVMDNVKKVLIVSASPHPDVNALRKTLEGNLNYEVKSIVGEANAGDISGYDLLVLHQLPGNASRSGMLLDKAKAARIPVWIITGSGTNFAAINSLNAGVTVRTRGSAMNEVTGVVNESFGLFTVPTQEADYVRTMPPLSAAFGDYSTAAGVEVLMVQKIGNVISSQPLLCMSEVENQRWAFLLGEGIWRWRFFDFQRNRSFELFDSFISRIAQFLCQNSDRSRFRVIYEPTHSETESVRFNAELFNENFELINSETVELVLTDASGKAVNYIFVADGSGYSLSCGKLKPGEYSFSAQVKSKKYPYTQRGKITVDSYNPELTSLKADFNLLRQLATQSGGILVSPDQLNDINAFLEKKGLIQATYYRENKYIDLLEWKWILLILLALATTEWIIRKREGYY